MDKINPQTLDSLPNGTRITALTDEFSDEFIKNAAGKWESLSNEPGSPLDFEFFDVNATHSLSPIPTDLERIAVNFLNTYQRYCDHAGLRGEIEKTVQDPTHIFDPRVLFAEKTDSHDVFVKNFDAAMAAARKKGAFDDHAYDLLVTVGKYRSMGRPRPCPDLKSSHVVVLIETVGGFLTAKIVETEAAFQNYLFTLDRCLKG